MTTENEAAVNISRRELIRDAAVLQVKLIIDGLRDLVLVPMSLVAAVISLLRPGPEVGTEFYDLLKLGKASERYINLFGAIRRVDGETESREDVDSMVTRIEDFVVTEYREGHITGQAREQLERAVRGLKKAANRSGSDDAPQEPPRPSNSSSDRGA